MTWHDRMLDLLSDSPCCGYHRDDTAAGEPTALSSLALSAWGRSESSETAAAFLADIQAQDGSVGIRAGEPVPGWPTSLAILAWLAQRSAPDIVRNRFNAQVERGLEWLQAAKSELFPRNHEVGHNTMLLAWPWVDGTHAWVEPTAMSVLALKAAGWSDHPRTRAAVKVLFDRQLAAGGCNYGNTRVLGRELRPQLQPTGMALVALCGETDPHARLSRARKYLEESLAAHTPTASLCWSLLGLAAHKRLLPQAGLWVEAASQRVLQRDSSPYKAALLLLAALGEESPLITLQRVGYCLSRADRLPNSNIQR